MNNHIISLKVLDLQKHPWVGLSSTVNTKCGNECPSDTTAVNQFSMNFFNKGIKFLTIFDMV